MAQLNSTAEKLEREAAILGDIIEGDLEDERRIDLAVTVAKRVRTQSTFLVRQLARKRDELQT